MSDALRQFVARAHAAGASIHTLDVSLDGRSVAQASIAPFARENPHRVYSVTKSLVGLVVLLLEDRGLVGLTDPIGAHFPEFDHAHEWIASTSVDDLLAMTGPHARTTFDGADWLGSYFRTAPAQPAGTLFTYDTSATYVLSALVERLSGTSLIEVLRRELFDPLGVGGGARMLTGPEGIGHGGSGLIIAPADLLVIAETVNRGGRRDAVEVLPSRAVSGFLERRSDTAMLPWSATFRAGYGRQVWLPGNGTWLMFGLGGQLVFGDPARRLAAVVTADTTSLPGGDQRLADALILALRDDRFRDEGFRDGEFRGGRFGDVALPNPKPPHAPEHASSIDGCWRLVGGEAAAPPRVTLTADAAGGRVQWDGGPTWSFESDATVTAETPFGPAAVSAGWSAPGVLDLRMSAAGDDITTVALRVVTSPDGHVTVQSNAFGPAATWSWRGTYRRATAAVA